ncbi:hypothetical protein GOP47_0000681 [Adiantum capillus-veneris]|uniref:HpcH/HpaI aldolase/citrate lyase domain-containing protein n=1 Tax=Adiantum capillus-veneris TaxID=13818 RepID=A0A9D4VDZ5_ADICA|nr:hypothetical protein GOP47_0000681 [Adiantum capillus-veneris]
MLAIAASARSKVSFAAAAHSEPVTRSKKTGYVINRQKLEISAVPKRRNTPSIPTAMSYARVQPANPFPLACPRVAKARHLRAMAVPFTAAAPPGPLKARLASGEHLYGAFLCSFSPTLAEILGWAGYDYVVIDMEHGPGDTFAALPCMQALASAGVPAILRIAANDPVLMKKAMDLGPQGVVVPMIETPSDAEKAIASCQYPPRGNRGAAHPIVHASMYGIDTSYLQMNEEVLRILQIESAEAVDHILDIAAVDGVDCLMLGPTDLSSSIGYLHDPGHENVMKLMHRAEKAVLSAPVTTYLGGFAMPHDPPEEMRKRGYHLISGAVDLALFRNAAVADVKANKVSTASQRILLGGVLDHFTQLLFISYLQHKES